MRNPKTGRTLAAVLVLVGMILLIAALFTPWYNYKVSSGGISESSNWYLGTPSQNGTVQYSCSGGISCPSQTSYKDDGLNNTGDLSQTTYLLVIGGVALGLLGAILGFAGRGNSKRLMPALALTVIALLLAVAAVGVYAGGLPGAASKDSPGHQGSGPWSTFFGSTTNSTGGVSLSTTWGPTTGWYLAIGAFVLFLIGLMVLAMARKEPSPEPMAPPMADASAPAMPPTNPPAPPAS